jgi:ATP-dependent DNA helicase RecQ
VEAKEEMQYALETILAMKQAFKPKDIVDVIMGRKNSNTKTYHLENIEQFGGGTDHDDLYWKAVLRQAQFEGLLQKEIEQYGVLKLTPAGNKFIKQPYSLYVTCDHDYSAAASEEDEELLAASSGASAAGDEALYVQLKSLRKSIASREKLPAYVIFDESSLKDMTLQYPCTVEELSHCAGVGIAKAQKYGQPFIDLIKKYVEDNDIERPQDIVVRSAVNKSGLKVYIIKSIDRRKSLEDIAAGKGISMDELLTEMEHIISSGAKLNIDYYIDDVIEPDHQEDLLDYWRNSESDSLEDAYEEFSDEPEYTEEEIRLMRIKFMADYGH